MTSEMFVKVALSLIYIVTALISAYLIPLINAKTDAADMEKLIEYVKMAVRCANQIYTPEEWQKKKEYVVKQTQEFIEKNLKIKLSDEQIDTIIEGMVNSVKQGVA